MADILRNLWSIKCSIAKFKAPQQDLTLREFAEREIYTLIFSC